jgi:hypothetical protein
MGPPMLPGAIGDLGSAVLTPAHCHLFPVNFTVAYFECASGLFRPIPTWVLACFHPQWPKLKCAVAYFDFEGC